MTNSTTLLNGTTNAPVAVVIESGLPPDALSVIETQWRSARELGNERLRATGRADLAHHGHWRWDRTWKVDGVRAGRYAVSGVRVGDEWQGAMSVYTAPVPAHLWPLWRKWVRATTGWGHRPQAVYVDYLETAPWNYEPFVTPVAVRYRGTGGRLMAEAVRLSLERELGGRVALYSLPRSEPFYVKIGMTPLFTDRRRDSPTSGLRYFEFASEPGVNFYAKSSER